LVFDKNTANPMPNKTVICYLYQIIAFTLWL